MNKRKGILFKQIIFFIILFILIIFCFVKLGDSIKMFEFQTEDEVISLFINNKIEFNKVKNDLINFKFHWSLKRGNSINSRSDWKSIRLKNNVNLIIKDSKHFNNSESMQNIIENNMYINSIFKKMEFKIITNNFLVDSNCLYFVKQTAIGCESGILYCPHGKTENPYINKMSKIEEEWYYYESD